MNERKANHGREGENGKKMIIDTEEMGHIQIMPGRKMLPARGDEGGGGM